MTATPAATPLSDAEYRAKTSAVLARIESTIDRWLQDDVIDIDTLRTGGLLELSFPNGSKIVLNTQPPLHELWMAARRGRPLDRSRRQRVLRSAVGLCQRAGRQGLALRSAPVMLER